MFYSNASSSYFNFNSNANGNTRLGFDDQYSASQASNFMRQKKPTSSQENIDSSRPRRQSVGQLQMSLDPPCRPATIKMLYKFRDDETGIVKLYGACDSGPVSLVGWVRSNGLRMEAGESEFQFSDGTGRIVVRFDIPTESEAWLLPRLITLTIGSNAKTGDVNDHMGSETTNNNSEDFQKENDSPNVSNPTLRYLRLVATVSPDIENGLIVMRGIHLREAHLSEASFHHTVECILDALKLSPAKTASTNSTQETDEDPLGNITLPANLSYIENPLQRRILRYIKKYRVSELGVNVKVMHKSLKDIDSSTIQSAIKELTECDAVLLIEHEGEEYLDWIVD